MKSDNLIEDIKSRLNIEDVVSDYVELKKSGQNLKGICPFHTEKTPSFMVNPSKQIFHCFGCNTGGDMFTFVMQYENITFGEAAEQLGRRAGLDLDSYKGAGKKNRGLKEKIYAINSEAAALFSENLQGNNTAMQYLRKRGIEEATISTFGLGFSKSDKDRLYRHLRSKDYTDEDIKASGLVFFGDRGPLDFFRNRLMFTITDQQSRIIAFGGRVMQAESSLPKYINSSDSPVFKKGETCYGLSQAKNSITQKGYCIIVEGYFDVIMCHQHGIQNVIAPLGTALTSGHLARLKRFTNKILLVFDGDPAGVSATKRSLELLFAEAFISKILLLPKGDDPDTFLRAKGAASMRSAMAKAITPADFMLRTTKDRLAAVRETLKMLNACPDHLLRDETIRQLADRSKINESALRDELISSSKKSQHSARPGDVAASRRSTVMANTEEELLLNIALGIPDAAEQIIKKLDLSHIETPIIRSIFEKIKRITEGNESSLSEEQLMRECEPEEQVFVSRHSVKLQVDAQEVNNNIRDCLKKISLRRIDSAMREAEDQGDETAIMRLRTEKTRIIAGA
ncbi:MAG: DNA primase [Nitrospiraceae bacterium]|nr:DNA primase [Nitrospiraceae bacterium]